ncbi:MAG: zf-HC2 domain-containing protein [Clostridia bacterium]|nr:zf-HC2 domain-containing protein [Clostridia bacterium]
MSKIHCNVIRDLLPLYADKAESTETRELVEEHLAECEVCREELEALQKKVCVLPDTDQTRAIRKFQRKWNLRQILKGAVIALTAVFFLVGGFFYLYAYGLPASSEDVAIHTGFQCAFSTTYNESDGTWAMVPITDRQTWIMDMYIKNGRGIRDTTTFQYDEVVYDAETQNPVSMTIRVRRAPFVMPWDTSDGRVRTGYTWPEGLEITEDSDFTVHIVFSDKTITYSMREEGLFTIQEHTEEFCPHCR